ncbi:MAG: transposase [Syntrophobacteraceae bacterium]
MKIEISVPEDVSVFKEIQVQPKKVFEMIRFDVRKAAGSYFSEMMNAELIHFLGRKPYKRKENEANYRNGSYGRIFTVKSIRKVDEN